MPIATPKQFADMLEAAQKGSYAYPAINCSNLSTLNAAMKGFADNKSDGIIQFSTGAGQFASGLNHKDAVAGVIVLAEAAHRLADQYNVLMALNTDHCQPDKAEGFLDPLLEATAARRARGENNLFQNHMLDASILPLEENMAISQKYLKKCAELDIILEVEAGVVGGEEDGVIGAGELADPKECALIASLGVDLFAAGVGNIHGKYPANWKGLDFEVLQEVQSVTNRVPLVLHGGTGIPAEIICHAASDPAMPPPIMCIGLNIILIYF